MKKMFLRLVLFCLSLWRLDGVFGDEEMFINEGDIGFLDTRHIDIKDDDEIQWIFGHKIPLTATFNKETDRITVYDDVLDGIFREKLNPTHRGSLIIRNIGTEHAGVYQLLVNQRVRICFHLFVRGKPVSVMEGDSFTLNTSLTKMKDGDVIQWWFWNKYNLMAEINVTANRFTVYNDVFNGIFRNRLKLDNQTGSLTITNIRTEHDGDYNLQITGSKILFKTIRLSVSSPGISRDSLNITQLCHTCSDAVKSVSVKEGDSVTLNTNLTEIQTDDLILWRFGLNKSPIANFNRASSKISINDVGGRFRDRLNLDHQTGSLTITNTRTTDSGLYEVTIEGKKEITYRFNVSVSGI
ncbi:uncharacterized protein LOC127520854 [Ctenopharyngodon idella]|uniref:uncharacterized protein LOC127520854 n=1 Tax=Ctenopharyngodon idella TaxID=7959 RepID=UPI0022309B15|nr:uncharacterized protein LOC127520854 [Ctenopharyngodon idella]